MRALPSAILLAAVLVSPAGAQDAVPDLKGTWSGVARSVVVGSGYHHPGTETDKEPPRIREVRFTYTVRYGEWQLSVPEPDLTPDLRRVVSIVLSRDQPRRLGSEAGPIS